MATNEGHITVRLATPGDAAGCLDIYAPMITETAVSFEMDVPSVDAFAARMEQFLATYPWLVAESNAKVVGYAYAGPHRVRTAYQWSVEASAYVQADFHRRGIARRLYDGLFRCLTHQGFHNVYAGATLPNDASVKLHESMGFRNVGVYEKVGFKFGRWHDVGWWVLPLDAPRAPQSPIPLPECRDELAAIVATA